MKAQDPQNSPELFPPHLNQQDAIESARKKMHGYANNTYKITERHLLARVELLNVLRDELGDMSSSISPLQDIRRIEDVMQELNNEIQRNQNLRIDFDISDAERMFLRIEEARRLVQADLNKVKQTPEVASLLQSHNENKRRSEEQNEVNVRMKAGKLQLLESKIGIHFDRNNPHHPKVINLIYDFNEAQGSATSQLEEKEVIAVFNMLTKHPETLNSRSTNEVIESASKGYRIIHEALNVKGQFRAMGDWQAAEPKIMDKLLPQISQVPAAILNSSAKEIKNELAQSIWDNSNYSLSATVAGGARSIDDENLNLVSSKTLDQALGKAAKDNSQQPNVFKSAYETLRKAAPNPFAKKAAPTIDSTAQDQSSTLELPDLKMYQAESTLAAQLFESAMTNTRELQILSQNNCLNIIDQINKISSSGELSALRLQISNMRDLASKARSLVAQASQGIEEISFYVSEDLVNIGARVEERQKEQDKLSTFTLSEEDLLSDKPLPSISHVEAQDAQSLSNDLGNELSEGLERARELRKLSNDISTLNLPDNASKALGSINSILAEADKVIETKAFEIKAKEDEIKTRAAENDTTSASNSFLSSLLRRGPGALITKDTAQEKFKAVKAQASRSAEDVSQRVNEWGRSAWGQASAAASEKIDASGIAALEGLRGLSGGVTYVALNTAAESARLAKRYPKAAAAAATVYGAVQVAALIVAAAPYVVGGAAVGAALNTETGRAVAGHVIEGAAIVGGAAVEAAASNPRATAAVVGAAGVISAGLALVAAAPYAAAAAAASTDVGQKVVGAIASGVGDGVADSARTQLEGGSGSVEAVESAVEGARTLASKELQAGSAVRGLVVKEGGDSTLNTTSTSLPNPKKPPAPPRSGRE